MQELVAQSRWHCEPSHWGFEGDRLRIEPTEGTDFWQRTHYGFRMDNGHFLHREMAGDFVLTAHVVFFPVHQYDQAGLMVRASADCWLKAAVEYEPTGPSRLGAVVTNAGYSDWSTQDFPPGVSAVWLRFRREADDYLVAWSGDGVGWSQLRLAHLHSGDDVPMLCGVYACSPKGRGFVCEFRQASLIAGRMAGGEAESGASQHAP